MRRWRYYLDTSLNVHAPEVSLSFDLNVVSQAAGGYGQTKALSGVGDVPILYGVRISVAETGRRVFSFRRRRNDGAVRPSRCG